ncbi:phosphocholine cytidylyltransferase family protein [uncultured Sphingomonas sp.]|uniref:phosphocholine cytidylyltransferase family protein n=1 Tax=uncultured Sphingomonas sp. TaxID=158754 RepID=UPI0025CF50A4|nr:phosphocholine cytidylyltransferase family protein [uncultured Sphingomonas sp.]
MIIKRAIILSAGQGSRLGPITADQPKCLIPFAGKTLLDWQIDALAASGIGEVVVVTGFRTEKVEAQAAQRGDVRVRTLFNPFYHVADNLGTCWMARGEMTEDFIILNGDTIISPEIVRTLLAGATLPITVTIDEKDDGYDSDDMKVRREGDRLAAIGKTLTPEETDAESIGMLAFRGEGPALFSAQIDRMMRTEAGTRNWYLKAIDALAATGKVGTVSIKGQEWQEVDFPADLAAASALTERWRSAGR